MNSDELMVKIFKALGHPIRYKIIKFLYNGPKCVCRLNEDIEFSQANLSQHLRILKDANLVKSEKVGLEMYYRLYNEDVKNIVAEVEKYVLGYINNIKELSVK
ncbi:winged helix-turn-helix transcriptional regulator [Caloramator sp. E03]|uniref:ArsR/SmtB family transcription factor n=1 Tax=Caloramator sp. E03 TaxID=2576307 RepID=UPI00111036BA|nr:metalloregulator ArsR/SmtB family transcription factor [Caloramator sp. E03]QCX32789.1 winged helix-turn-helix transcriptional regulator [Caloramator sp. E03]